MYKFVVLSLLLAVASASLPRLPYRQIMNGGWKLMGQDFPRIVGGRPVDKGEVPWQLSLQSGSFHYCGGIIYDERNAITAGHCDIDGATVKMVAGDHSLSDSDGDEQTVTGTAAQHPDYNSMTTENDINVIKLNLGQSFEFNQFVSGIAFPPQGTEYAEGDVFQVSGWGSLSSGGMSPDILQVVDVPFVTDDVCNEPSAYGGDVYDSMICAGNLNQGGVDSCQGDSGGPMWMGSELVGIVSWGYGCAVAGYPGVYTQVSYFTDWVESTVQK